MRFFLQFLRLALMALGRRNRRPFVVTPLRLGLPPGPSYDKVEELLEALEGATHL